MTTVLIDSNNVQAGSFVEYARSLPFATVVEEKKKSFEEASRECNAVTVDVFIDELKASVKEYFNHA